MISACFGDNLIKHWRSISAPVLCCKATSGSSAGSAMVAAISSSNSTSICRRMAESALNRAIARSHVETGARFELGSVTPNIEKHVAQQVFCQGLVSDHTQHEP